MGYDALGYDTFIDGIFVGDTHDLPNKLQQTKSPVHNDTTCSDLIGTIFDPATMTCAANLDGSSGTCQVYIM